MDLQTYYEQNGLCMTKSVYGAGAGTSTILPAKAHVAYHLVNALLIASNNAANDGLQVQLSYTEFKKDADAAQTTIGLKLVPSVANSGNAPVELNTLTTVNSAVNMVVPSGTFSLCGVTVVYKEVEIDE